MRRSDEEEVQCVERRITDLDRSPVRVVRAVVAATSSRRRAVRVRAVASGRS